MLSLFQNFCALLAGLFSGSAVNMALISLSPLLITPPAGVDPTNAESLVLGIELFEPQHFVMPFLAHAMGTLAGALVCYLIAASYHKTLASCIGLAFFCGGIAASLAIPAPVWFISTDLTLAYLPMAWLAIKLGQKIRPAGIQLA